MDAKNQLGDASIESAKRQAEIVLRSIESSAKLITPTVVEYFRRIDFTPADKTRYEQLVQLAIFGTLDEKQRTEFENFRRVKVILDLIREKVIALAESNSK